MRLLAAVLLALPLLASCGGETEKSAAPEAGNTPTTTLEASPSKSPDADAYPTATVAPDVGENALRVGDWREGRLVRTRLSEIRFPFPPELYREPIEGDQFVGLRITQCLRDVYDPAKEQQPTDIYSTYVGEWYLVTPSGEQIASSSSYSDWPRPKFPESVTMNAGDCLKGWVAPEVPDGIKIEKVVYRGADGVTVAEWLP